MNSKIESVDLASDSAAVFACALSLWEARQKIAASEARLNLSESYNGVDQFMRELMRISNQFEMWACTHIDFNQNSEVWPYFLGDRFGEACLAVLGPDSLAQFDESDCLRVALRLGLPIKLDHKLPIPIDVRSFNPIRGSAFREFRIQTVRDSIEVGDVFPFLSGDEPFDDEFGQPYFGLYGVDKDGALEHIADRKSYSEAVRLAGKLAPGIEFPESPTSVLTTNV